MRVAIFLYLLFPPLAAMANMASPVQEGSWSASPFISRHVDILREYIEIVPDQHFQTAQFVVAYHIRAADSGTQVPLLFYAAEFRDGFRVWVDDREVALSRVPRHYRELEGTRFTDFGYLFRPAPNSGALEVIVEDSPTGGFYVSTDDLKFFEADLSAGEHVIRVEYTADHWIDHSGWVNEYSFRYVLSPAKYWKSFGSLEVTLDASSFDGQLTTSLGPPDRGDLATRAVWRFDSLPGEVLTINHRPPVNATAKMLMALKPAGLTCIVAFLLVVFHLVAIRKYRLAYPERPFNWVMTIGSILIPFLILIAHMYSFELIDAAIGPEAGRYHGYTSLSIVLYPFLLMIYWTVMWLADRLFARAARKTLLHVAGQSAAQP